MEKCNSLKIFERITQIPRPSSKEDKMVDFLVEFAKKHKLEYKICGLNNVIIYKKSNIKGNDKTIILQGHIDMVCEKVKESKIDFNNDPIELIYDGDFIRANGTTLGADNGLGVSIILHVLESKTLKHPNIEAVFTTQEETTMGGALTLDYSLLKGKTLLSIDGTDEKHMETASAGMVTMSLDKSVCKENVDLLGYEITISKLKGGHSGGDVHLNRSNANKLIVKLLKKLNYPCISSIKGGDKDNAIPHTCSVTVACDDIELIRKEVKEIKKFVVKNNKDDENVAISIRKKKIKRVYNHQDSKNLVKLLDRIKNGVLESNEYSFPLTSLNLAKISDNHIRLSLRSSVVEYENKYLEDIKELADKYNYSLTIDSKAPFFEENKNSYIVNLCKSTYKSLYNEEITSGPVHAGLEGGVFSKNIKNLDICVIAPNLYDIHSTSERASISSLTRVEKWVEEILKNF